MVLTLPKLAGDWFDRKLLLHKNKHHHKDDATRSFLIFYPTVSILLSSQLGVLFADFWFGALTKDRAMTLQNLTRRGSNSPTQYQDRNTQTAPKIARFILTGLLDI